MAKIVVSSMLSISALLLCGLQLSAQDNPQVTLTHATAFGVTEPLRELAKIPQPVQYGFHEANPVRRIPKQNFGHPVDTAEQNPTFPSEFSIVKSFVGLGNGFPGFIVGGEPPDANMAIGGTQVLQWVNTSFTICDKSTTTCGPAIPGNTLWRFGIPGTLCANNNDGEALAQYDRMAHRWVLSQNVFVSPYATCIAISDTDDANGTYHVWQFSVPGNGFPDSPKIGIWPTSGVNNGYYQAQNNFGPGGSGFMGPQICAYDRHALLTNTAPFTQICFQLSATEDSLLPADLDSILGPPNTDAGTPQDEFYIGSIAAVDNSHLSLYQFHADFTTPANSLVLGSPNTILQMVPTYSGSCSGAFGGACVPQAGTTALLDSLGDRLMYRFAYWNDGPPPNATACAVCGGPHAQHWYVNGDVEASGGQIGVRWYEFRAPARPGIGTLTSTTLTTFQAGTYAPDSNWRWMGSVAQDKAEDILAGYSESSSNIHPAIGLAGRKAGDPLSQLSDEVLVPINNNGSQTSSPWGEYSSMRIDPVDNCTFWYTTEYYMVTASDDWSTQIASAKFSGCQ
jgi:hypothetical protein